MNEAKSGKITMKRHWELFLRALKVYMSFPKPIMLSRTVYAFFNAVLPFINIYFSARILNELAGARERDSLTFLVLLTVGLNAFVMLAKSALNRWKSYCESEFWASTVKVFTDKFLSMDYADVENAEIRQLHSTIEQHQQGMGFGLNRPLPLYDGIIDGLIKIVLSAALAFSLFTLKTPAGSAYAWLDSPLASAGLVVVLLLSLLLSPFLSMTGGKVFAKMSEENNKGNRFFSFYFFNLINGSGYAKDVRIYEQKRLIDNNMATFLKESLGFSDYLKYHGKFNAASAGVTCLVNGLIYLFVAMKSLAGAFGVGGIVQYVGAITQLSGGFLSVLYNAAFLTANTPFLSKCFEFLDIPNRKYQGTLSVEKRDDAEYIIEFRDVSFKYPGYADEREQGADNWALRHLNLKINIGRRMAVVGMNGSGKTTMIKLLCRLYDPTEGIITLNGVDIKKYNYDEYMALFSVVFQDFKLLPFTLGQNVAASVRVDRNKAERTLGKAGFGARRASMPKGLDTWLYKEFEEDGVDISGGEAQKIALARALYKEAPFIVLDEPTAALDPVAEYEIYTKFNEIVGDKTAVYISHRLSSCRFCDDIAVFHEGRLAQRGSHEALLAEAGGKYAELWNAQAQYYNTSRAEEEVTA